MLPLDRLIRIAVLLLVIVSGCLLGLSLSSFRLTMIVVVGAITGYLITDHWRLIRLDGMLANIASVAILVLAMRNFFPEDSTGKLLSVADLLVYLQTLLMFQEKTPRLIWQILVLSMLQVVVSAIFSLDFEGGLLFLCYFPVAGFTLVLQTIYASNQETWRRNQAAALQEAEFQSVTGSLNAEPIMFFDPQPRSLNALRPLIRHLVMWMAIAFCFTAVMFYMIPRHTHPWFGSAAIEVASTGFSKSVDLLNRGEIQQSNQLIFRVSFSKLDEPDKILNFVEPPYFRGMALSSLVIEDGRTNWRAPHDRIHAGVYQDIGLGQIGNSLVRQRITLEENTEPLVYSIMPSIPTRLTPRALEFCHEISALTRCRVNKKMELAPFKYELLTNLDRDGAFLAAWPYCSNSESFQELPMSEDLPQQRWLTYLEPQRYPTIVNLASTIVQQRQAEKSQIGRIELVKALEAYFLEPGQFKYTLDFRTVQWSDNLDPIEDFVRNHRTGHCELFASALTLMLRSQDIPARLVVGFHGGDHNNIANCLMVRSKHAHAWVEVYLRPEDCTSEMFVDGAAGAGGAWLRLDPTPPTAAGDAASVGVEAMDLARTMWQDYVLGMATESVAKEPVVVPDSIARLLQNVDFENWQAAFQLFENAKGEAQLQYALVALVLVGLLICWLVSQWHYRRSSQQSDAAPAGVIRRWIAHALSLISPKIGQWVLSENRPPTNTATAFYRRLIQILKSHGMERQPAQTHREFALAVGQRYSSHSRSAMIHSTVWEVSEIFNQIRFGNQHIPPDLQEQVELCLDELESGLATSPIASDLEGSA